MASTIVAWAGLALGIINLGIVVIDKYLLVPVDFRIGADLAQLRRDLNRAIFRASHCSYLAREDLPLDKELRREVTQIRDALSQAFIEGSDGDLIASLALSVHKIDEALAKPRTKRWDAAEEQLQEAFGHLHRLSTQRAWRWKA